MELFPFSSFVIPNNFNIEYTEESYYDQGKTRIGNDYSQITIFRTLIADASI